MGGTTTIPSTTTATPLTVQLHTGEYETQVQHAEDTKDPAPAQSSGETERFVSLKPGDTGEHLAVGVIDTARLAAQSLREVVRKIVEG